MVPEPRTIQVRSSKDRGGRIFACSEQLVFHGLLWLVLRPLLQRYRLDHPMSQMGGTCTLSARPTGIALRRRSNRKVVPPITALSSLVHQSSLLFGRTTECGQVCGQLKNETSKIISPIIWGHLPHMTDPHRPSSIFQPTDG